MTTLWQLPALQARPPQDALDDILEPLINFSQVYRLDTIPHPDLPLQPFLLIIDICHGCLCCRSKSCEAGVDAMSGLDPGQFELSGVQNKRGVAPSGALEPPPMNRAPGGQALWPAARDRGSLRRTEKRGP